MRIIRSKRPISSLNNQRLFTRLTLREIEANTEFQPITLPEQLDFFNILEKKRLTTA
jgi:hypothetical protein